MYATIHQFRRSPAEEPDGWGATLAHALHGIAQPVGLCTVGQLSGLDGAVLAFWSTLEEAASAADRRTARPMGLDCGSYEVVDEFVGLARNPQFAQLTWLGAGSQAQADAAERAGRARIWPAIKDIEGVVGSYALRGADRSAVIVGFATTVEAHEAVRRAIFSTELLPWEDPALLTGPDRVDIGRVFYARLPARAMTGERS